MSTTLSTNSLSNAAIGRHDSLVMTDYWFLFGMWIVVFWAIDPLGWKVDFIPIIKQFPVFVIAPAFVLVAYGRGLFQVPKLSIYLAAENRNLLFVIVLFSALVTLGSLFARFLNGIDNGFLTMGLFALTAPLTAWFISRSINPHALVKKLVMVYIFWAVVAVILQAINFGEREVFHSREHLVIASLVFFYLTSKVKTTATLALLLIIFSAILAKKNSAYLTAILICALVFYAWAMQRSQYIKDRMLRSMFWVKFFLFGLINIGIFGLVYTYWRTALPTGNPEYRLHTYELAWKKFISSPLWGSGYTGAASEKFDQYTVAVSTQVLPTHSDPLDILANGGLIGFVLWISIFVGLLHRWYLLLKYQNQQTDQSLQPYLHTIFYMIFAGVIVCSFNPILNSPNLAWSFWALIGAVLAVHQPTVQALPAKLA